jgi:hypothetical protein
MLAFARCIGILLPVRRGIPLADSTRLATELVAVAKAVGEVRDLTA